MRIDEIMTRHVTTVSLDDSTEQVRSLFQAHRFHHIVVTDQRRVVGIISDRDVLQHISLFVGKSFERSIDSATLRKRAHQIMTRSVVTVPPETEVTEAARILLANKISCLPVTDEAGHCVGIVTTADLLRWLVRQHTPAAPAATQAPPGLAA